ncbi:MAG: GNAT family N-acetyltransferase [Paenalcaligenes sp.]
MLANPEHLKFVDRDLQLRLDIICHHNPVKGWAPFYQFSMQTGQEIAGVIHLRIGTQADLLHHLGHIGYEVFPRYRGRAYARRACQLLLPLAKLNGLEEIWITCNPDNTPSRRTCENLGATYVDTVDVPPNSPMYAMGERHKRRYHLPL